MQKILLILHLLLILSLPAFLQVTNQDAHIVMEANTYLVLSGNFKNNGTFNQKAGTVKFTGMNPSISGTVVPVFFKMQLYMPASSVLSLSTDIEVESAIQFALGLINLNTRNITLAPTALLLGESETSRITGPSGGVVEITVPLNAPNSVNPGNLGATLTYAVNFGNTTIRRGHQSQMAGSYNRSILRFFQITPSAGSLAGIRLRMNYLNAELNGLNVSCLIPYKSINMTGWTYQLPASRNISLKYVESPSIPNYPYWTLSVYDYGGAAACLGARQAVTMIADQSKPGNDFIKRIYPTAGVRNNLYVETGNLHLQNIQVILYDAQGKRVLNKQIAYQSQWLTIPSVSAGVYQVKILSAEWIWQGKFIKE